MIRLSLILGVVFIPMLLEARRSRRNEAWLRRRGAVEPPDDVFGVMQLAYPLCFLLMAGEGAIRGGAPPAGTMWGGALFVAGKGLKYWAIATLGRRWTFRVLVIPGAPRILAGPYRWLRHPNYAGVVGELAGVGLLANAPIAGLLSILGFGALMLARVRVEEAALDARGHLPVPAPAASDRRSPHAG